MLFAISDLYATRVIVRLALQARRPTHALAYAPGVEMPRQIEEERAPVPRALRSGTCLPDARSRWRGSQGQHGASSAKTLALKRQTTALVRLARETMAAIE